jgi:hypothetical protein
VNHAIVRTKIEKNQKEFAKIKHAPKKSLETMLVAILYSLAMILQLLPQTAEYFPTA